MDRIKVLRSKFPPVEHMIEQRDCILYGLGIGLGFGADPGRDLIYCYERGLEVSPAMVNVIAQPRSLLYDPEFGIDALRVVHGEQSFDVHRPLQVGATYVGTFRVSRIVDKGIGKSALLYLEKQLRKKGESALTSTVRSTFVLRGDGGCGGDPSQPERVESVPSRPPDLSVSLATSTQAALIYRLSGDYNSIHIDPEVARAAGFERPVLHGLCSMGVVTHGLIRAFCDDGADRVSSVGVRFTAPLYPGETILAEFWREGPNIRFRGKSSERGMVVMDNGHAVLRA